MKKYLTAGILAGAVALSPAHAANFIDQNAEKNYVYMGLMSIESNFVQSFQQDANNISGAGVFLASGVGLSNITISLWNALPYANNARMLASATGQTTTTGRWFDLFWQPVRVTSGNTYYLRFTDDTGQYGLYGDVGNGYSKGKLFSGTSSLAPNPVTLPDDLAFRTYASDVVPALLTVPAVPEPATWAMMLVGFGAVGFALRRRQSVRVTYA
jgi:PEP-CTERM motif